MNLNPKAGLHAELNAPSQGRMAVFFRFRFLYVFFSLFLAPEGELSHLLVDLKPITLWALEDVKTSALIVSPEQEYGAGGKKKVPNGCFHV